MIKADDYLNLDQAVAAWVSSGPNETLVLSDKAYPLQAQINSGGLDNMAIRGEGDSSQIQPSFTGTVISMGIAAAETRNPLLEGFVIAPTVSSIGVGVYLQKCVRQEIRNVDVGTPELASYALSHGFHLDNFDDAEIQNVQGFAWWRGLVLNGGSFGADIDLIGANKFQNAAAIASVADGSCGVYIGGGAGGVKLNAGDIIYCGRGVILATDMAAGLQNREIFLDTVYIDSCGWDGLRALANSFGSLHLNGTWVASNGLRTNGGDESYGVRVEPGQFSNAHLRISGADIFNNVGSGVGVNGGSLTVGSSLIRGNGTGSSGGDGIGCYNSSMIRANISANTIIANGKSFRGKGVTCISGLPDVLIAANDVQGNGQQNIDLPNQSSRRVAVANLSA